MTGSSSFPPEVEVAATEAVHSFLRDERCGAALCLNMVDGPRAALREVIATAVMADRARRAAPHVGGLTKHQKKVLDYLVGFFAEHGFCPSYDDIRTFLGLASKSGVHRVVLELEERGAIKRLPGRSRAITIITPTAT